MKRIATGEAPAAVGPYSQGTVEGDFLFTAGQVALTPEGELVRGSIEDETHQVMRNLEAILGAAGCRFANVVKTTIYITDPDSYRPVNGVYGSYFPDGEYPARECVGVPFLPLPDARVEISMTAALDRHSPPS
jgi:2-iminobutanoate/2-iminopropanoate deaminase